MTVWVVICEESQEERARRARREQGALREAEFFGLMRFKHSAHAYSEPGSHTYLFGEIGTSMSDPALLGFCARFPSKAAAEAALGLNRDDGFLYHFVELTEEQVALLDLGDVE